MRFFDDFTPGSTETYGPVAVTKDSIVSFAREYDPQPFHTDEEAAKGTFVGTLIASGWHTCALNMRLIAEGFLLESASLGAPGIEEVQWLKPVRPGDALRSRATVLEARPSKSRPEVGLVQFGFEVVNQTDEAVLRQRNWILIGRRGATIAGGGRTAPAQPRSPAIETAATDSTEGAGFYLEDLVPGLTSTLGSSTFEPAEIIRFAKAYDPQPFHIDRKAARQSLFGDLCASGWHTAAVWMKLMIGHRDRHRREAERAGLGAPRLGPSPGFKNLKWTKPVYAGDTVTYRSAITGTRPSASRPGWGLAFHRNSGVNQYGEEVFSFDGTVFWERRPEG